VDKTAGTKSGGREFAIDTAVVAVTQFLLKMRGLVTIPLIVKILGTAEYGVWVQVLTFTAFLGSLFSGNLHVPLVRFIAGDAENKSSIYTTILGLTAAVAVAGGAIICLFADPWSEFLLGAGGYASYIYLSVLTMLFGNVRQLNTNVYRATGRLKLRSAVELFATFGNWPASPSCSGAATACSTPSSSWRRGRAQSPSSRHGTSLRSWGGRVHSGACWPRRRATLPRSSRPRSRPGRSTAATAS
jgi:hypothetical protein